MQKISEQQQIKLGEIILNISKKDNFNLLYYYISKIVYSTNDLSLTLKKLERAVNIQQTDLDLLMKLKKMYEEVSDRILDELCAFYNDEN
ncbi:MAG TPA: hypothetical protein PLT36_01505 [Erysipelotrichaceae bacterium]|jgi:hypothetical protein|nr:hypothetical protein [Erysipelotrichaceae bacterium]HQA84500.1 hypothetical protein [Erysipelotrichaceae bacterium]